MTHEKRDSLAAHGELTRTLEHLTRALLDSVPNQVERPRVSVVPVVREDLSGELADGTAPDQELVEPVVLRPRRGVDLLAELAFLDR